MKPTISESPSGRVLYLGADQGLIRDLTPVLDAKGVRLSQYGEVQALVEAASSSAPDVVMLDTAAMSGIEGVGEIIADLRDLAAPLPHLICVASKERGEDTMEHRLAAMRAGVASYLVAPLALKRVASRIVRMCGVIEPVRYRVLMAAADPKEGRKIATLLANSGMETLVVDEPMKILARMLAFRPNLILMDFDWPDVSGAELAAIIRDHDDFYGIPILFLARETDLCRQLDALKAGGDGFIPKPVRREPLMAAIDYRMRMSRWLQDRRTLVNRRESARGFLPRDVFMRHLDRVIYSAEMHRDGTGLLILELDAHREILDKLGLSATERLLRELEGQLSKSMTAEESATRMDDFRYALLARRDGVNALEALAGQICHQLSGLRPQDPEEAFKVTVSVGVGPLSPPPEDAFTLVSRAEKAVLSAQRSGGHRVHLWSPTATGALGSESMLRRLVTAALAQDGLLLRFQPILSLNSQQDELYEAQIRLTTMDGEEIPPADFLSVAERGELLPRIDRWVLRRALEVMHDHQSSHPRLRLMVHQSVATLAAPEWFPWLRDQIVQRHLTRIYPLLEFQMTDVRQHRVEAKQLIERLRNYGIQVCVGNVSGTREEVSLLGRLGVPLAKLSFQVTRLTDQTQLKELVQALQSRGIAVIAPGIDDQATVSRVWMCRPDFIQGNYLQMPSLDLSFDFQRMAQDA